MFKFVVVIFFTGELWRVIWKLETKLFRRLMKLGEKMLWTITLVPMFSILLSDKPLELKLIKEVQQFSTLLYKIVKKTRISSTECLMEFLFFYIQLPYRRRFIVQSNLAIRNFLVTLKLFLNAKSSLSLWSKWQIGRRKWFQLVPY